MARAFHIGGQPLLIGGAALHRPRAAAIAARTASPLDVMQVHSGHSLVVSYMGEPWPGKLIRAHEAIGSGYDPYTTVAASTIPGSPMWYRWQNDPDGVNIRPGASPGIAAYELLVICEGVPLYTDRYEAVPGEGFDRQGESYDWFQLWINHAWENGNGGAGAEVMLYSVWNEWTNPGPTARADETIYTFRERLDIDGARWEEMQDFANEVRPAGMPYIYMIPGHAMWARIYDDIQAETAPFTGIGDLFGDEIHPNSIGGYALACLMWACIHHRDPAELPDTLDGSLNTTAQANYIRTMVWDLVRSYPRTGVPS